MGSVYNIYYEPFRTGSDALAPDPNGNAHQLAGCVIRLGRSDRSLRSFLLLERTQLLHHRCASWSIVQNLLWPRQCQRFGSQRNSPNRSSQHAKHQPHFRFSRILKYMICLGYCLIVDQYLNRFLIRYALIYLIINSLFNSNKYWITSDHNYYYLIIKINKQFNIKMV